MASKHIHEIIAGRKGFKNAQKGVKSLSSSMKTFAVGLVSAAAAYKAFGVAFDSIKLAGKLEGVERGFKNMSKEAGFSVGLYKKLDKALNGTADQMTIMTQANNAMLLGIADSEEQMADMFDVAQRLARAVGQDATFGIESLVTGLGRQSKLMLDNLGIMVDTNKAYEDHAEKLGTTVEALTDAEKKQGFINAAMEEGKSLVNKLGEENLTTADKLSKFTTSISNFKTEIGEALIESGVLDELTKYSDAIVALARDWLGLAAAEEASISKERELTNELEKEMDTLDSLRFMLSKLNTVRKHEGETFKDVRRAKQGLIPSLKNEKLAYQDVLITEKEAIKIKEARIMVDKLLERTGLTQAEVTKQITTQIKTSSFWVKQHTNDLAEHIEQKEKNIEMDQLSADALAVQLVLEERAAKKRETIAKAKKSLKDIEFKDMKKLAMQGMKISGANAKDTWNLTATLATAEAAHAVIKAFKTGGPFPANIAAAALVASQQAPSLATIFANKPEQAQTGFEGVVGEPTTFTVGEGGADEYVSVTPLEGVNNAGGGGQGITVNISGNVMSEQFVEEELSERIQEAVRKGVDFGIS